MRVVYLFCHAALMLLFFQPAFASYSTSTVEGSPTYSTPGAAPLPVPIPGQGVVSGDYGGVYSPSPISDTSPVIPIGNPMGPVMGAPLIQPHSLPDPPESTPLPAPAAPKSLTPEQIKMFFEQAEQVRLAYQRILNGLEADGKKAEVTYFNKVAWCEKTYAGHELHLIEKRNICNRQALDAFEATVDRLKKAMEGTKVAYGQAIANLKEAFAKESGIKADDLPSGTTDVDYDLAGNKLCKIDGIWKKCDLNPSVVYDLDGETAPVETPAPSTSTSPATPAPATPAPSTSTSTTNNAQTTTTNTTQLNQEIKFEDKNDIGDYCKDNSQSLACIKAGEVPAGGDDWGGIWDALKANGEGKGPKPFVLDKFLNGGARAQCPAPLQTQVQGVTISLSFEWVCRLLEMVRGVVIAASSIITGMFVLRGIK